MRSTNQVSAGFQSAGALVLTLLPGGLTPAFTQGLEKGTITGRVADETKAVLPGVTVTVLNLGRQSRSVVNQ